MIIGQTKILDSINKITSLHELPKSIIISGDVGMGRHTVSDFICNKFDANHALIDYELSLDILNEMYNLSIPTLYIIDFDKLGENKRIERFQNTLLKFIEEPPEFAWIIIIIHNSINILETVRNRCRIFNLQAYSMKELQELNQLYNKNFSDEDLLLLRTPYNIINTTKETIIALEILSENIVSNIHKATISNTLSIRTKFEDGLDIALFINVITETLFRWYSINNDVRYFKAILLTKEIQSNLHVLNINKVYLIDNYLLRLKELLND